MGAAPPSKLVPPLSAHPSRPYASHTINKCLRDRWIPSKGKPSILQTLIWHQDWQRVLIRLNLYPQEAKEKWEINVYEMNLLVFPLHLVCALDPPCTVVQLCWELYPDAAGVPVETAKMHQTFWVKAKNHHPPSWWHVRRNWKAWRSQRRGAFPVVEEDELSDSSIQQRQLLLPFVDDMDFEPDDDASSWSQGDDDDDEEESSDASSLSSKHSFPTAKNVILQLSPDGGLAPLLVNTSNDTNSTSSVASSEVSLFRVKWDLKPLWKQVADRGMLLPLHVAILFRSNPEVVNALVQFLPLAALSDVLGMLPIHWVAAGWTLPPLQPPPTFPTSLDPKPGPLATLHVLRRALPELIHIRSGNHGMLASDYIQECMDNNEYRDLCLRVLSDGIEYMVDYGSVVSKGTIVFCDTDETSSYPSLHLFAGLSALILDEEWAKAISVIEEDALSTRKWYYGVDRDTVGTSVWKRLPIHLACANGAPLSLIDLLLNVFPESAVVEDPCDGSLPLHIACRAGASLPVVRRLVEESPESVLAVDGGGRVALHEAVLAQAPYPVIEYLIFQDPDSVVALDQHGRTPLDYAIEKGDNCGPVVDLCSLVLDRLEKKSNTSAVEAA